MGNQRITLPKNFDALIKAGDLAALKAVFETCDLNARGGYSKATALSFHQIPDELVRWLVAQGADINAADHYGKTPLHAHARSWCGNAALFLELGADIEAVDHDGSTPLHAAAASYKPEAVRVLLAHGANVHAKNNRGVTPLGLALANCRPADLKPMAEVADLLLAAGDTITPDMRQSVTRVGTEFEFHRAGYNPDYVDATDAGLSHVYALFGVPPVPRRAMHDDRAPITVKTDRWQTQHGELWDLLVPSSGHAATVQGEVIRITGKLSHELLDNGGCNWDADYKTMLAALPGYLATGKPLDAAALEEIARLTHTLRDGSGDEEPARLCELAVRWVLQNPTPMPLDAPAYTR